MTEEEIKLLDKLLNQLITDDLAVPNMPKPIWKTLHRLIPWPAVEVLITQNGKDFLLTYRKDENWDNWHIPGGFMFPCEQVEEACRRVAKRELGIDIKFVKLLMTHAWQTNDHGTALSLLCVCKPLGKPQDGKFFTEIPEGIIPEHGEFVKKFLAGKK